MMLPNSLTSMPGMAPNAPTLAPGAAPMMPQGAAPTMGFSKGGAVKKTAYRSNAMSKSVNMHGRTNNKRDK